MRETEYAYGVARIRANETSLLTKADLEQLISAEGYKEVFRFLTGKGWEKSESLDICENELNKAWLLVRECAPDANLLRALVIGNDFTNVKAAIKATFSNIDPEGYMTSPNLCDPSIIIKAVNEKDFDILPDYLKDCADEAYHAISGGGNGQSAEMIIDKAALEAKLEAAKEAESELLVKIATLSCISANIKIAIRSARTGKTEQFALDSMCNIDSLDNDRLVKAAFAGEKLGTIIVEAGFPEIAEEADKDFNALEIKCDNLVTEWIESAKYLILGPDPIIAYYYAKAAEVKNVRIILSAKAASIPTETIQQRVREIYV